MTITGDLLGSHVDNGRRAEDLIIGKGRTAKVDWQQDTD